MNDIIIAIIGSGALGATAGAVVSWILNRRLFQQEVDRTAAEKDKISVEAADTIVSMYRDLNTELRNRIAILEDKVCELAESRQLYQERTKMMARVIATILRSMNGGSSLGVKLDDLAESARITDEDMGYLKKIIVGVED